MITVIDLNYAGFRSPGLSETLVEKIFKTLKENKKALLFLNRRGESRAYLCEDCSHRFTCKHCDIALTLHSYPRKHLLCHHCNYTEDIPYHCPHCHGTKLKGVGLGIQSVEDGLKKIFGENVVYRADSDKKRNEWLRLQEIQDSPIILATELWNTLPVDNIGLVGFLLVEAEMTIPEYDIEEQIYANVSYNIRRWAEVFLQTYVPKSSLIQHLSEGNYKTFLESTLAERKRFWYPPYKELVYIWVKDKNQERVKDIIYKLKNKLEIEYENEIELYFDRDIWIKRAGEWQQKIVLKGNDLLEKLQIIKGEVLKNRGITVEWR